MPSVRPQKRQAIEKLQNNLKEEYRAVFDFDVAFFQTVRCLSSAFPWLATMQDAGNCGKLRWRNCC